LWSGPFAPQLALGRVHPELAPVCEAGAGYALDPTRTTGWFELPAGRGFAGYGLSRALRMLLDVLGGLSALHDTRTPNGEAFVHGELTPSLMRVDTRGVLRLFPIAPRHWQESAREPGPEIAGYLAPERLLGDAIDRRADVFSAGVLLWEALAGRRLFEHDSPEEIVTRLMGGKVLLPELPPELAWAIPLKAVAMRALSVDPEQRFANCAELVSAIEAAARMCVASHAEVAAHFAAPPPSRMSPPPPRFPRLREVEEEFQSAHKSSLSALVAPAARRVAEVSELELELPKPRGAARRALTTLAWLLLLAAIGAAGFTRRAGLRSLAENLLRRAPATLPLAPTVSVASEPAPILTVPAATSAAPAETAAPADSIEVTPAAPADSIEVTPAAPERAKRAPHVPAARDVRGRPAARPAGAPQAKPAPRPRDKEAEQYGI
jgi:serine/threonine-protein kinase